MRLGVRVGDGCARLHDRMMRDLQVNVIELDEQWDFIGKKERHVAQGDPAECGDVWLFVALSATHKAVLSYVVGKRTAENTRGAHDGPARAHPEPPAITSDGYAPYIGAIEAAFGLTWTTRNSRKSMSEIRRSRMPRIATRPVTSLASIRS